MLFVTKGDVDRKFNLNPKIKLKKEYAMKYIVFYLALIMVISVPNVFAKIDKKAVAGMWLFEEGGGDVAKDISGNGNDGAIAGPKKWVKGKFGGGLQFDGSSVWVEVKDSDSLVLPELSMMAWGNIKPAKGTRWQSIMMKGQNPRNFLLCVDKDTQKLQISITKGAPDAWGGPIAGPEVTDGDWHHFAGVIGQKTGMVLYLDGQKIAQEAYAKPSLNPNPALLRIGDGSAGGHQLDGVLDEVAIFNIPLEEADITNIMENGLEVATGLKAPVESLGKLTGTWGQIKDK